MPWRLGHDWSWPTFKHTPVSLIPMIDHALYNALCQVSKLNFFYYIEANICLINQFTLRGITHDFFFQMHLTSFQGKEFSFFGSIW